MVLMVSGLVMGTTHKIVFLLLGMVMLVSAWASLKPTKVVSNERGQ